MLFSASRRIAFTPKWARDVLWRRARAAPSLDLRFADNKSLVDATTGQNLVTFTRASSGTYVDSQGVIRTATTNLLLRSEEFDNASWNKGNMTVTANALAAPNGTVTADLIDTATETSGTVPSQAVNVSNSTTYILSVYVKTGSATWIRFRTGLGTGSASLWYDINNGSFSASNATFAGVSAATAGDGWRRVVLTVSYGASDGGTRNISITPTSSNGGTAPFGTVYLWGAQLEQSSTVGEYIPTTSTINSAPRFDHNPTTGESLGLLVEEQRTNLLLQSNGFDTTWTNSNSSETAAAGTAPDGTNTAWEVQDTLDTVSTTHSLSQTYAGFTSGTSYSFSVWVKSGTLGYVALLFPATAFTTGLAARFNLTTGATTGVSAGVTATSVLFNNGWYKCTITATATSTASGIVSIRTSQANSSSYIGDGTGTILIWGAQLEAGAFPTSYIPTTTAAVTRSADVASITGSNFSYWYRQDEGTILVDASPQVSNVQSYVIAEANDATALNRLSILKQSTSGAAAFAGLVSNVTQAFTNSGAWPASGIFAGAYKSDDFASSLSGLTVAIDSSGAIPTVTQLTLGRRGDSSNQLTGAIRRLTYWPQRLPNPRLQQITQ